MEWLHDVPKYGLGPGFPRKGEKRLPPNDIVRIKINMNICGQII
jgi:hypothetical protein